MSGEQRACAARPSFVAIGAYLLGFGVAFAAQVAVEVIAGPADETTDEKITRRDRNNCGAVARKRVAADPELSRTPIRHWVDKPQRRLRQLAARRDGICEYILVTLAYWGSTITDGAIRMLVLFQFY